MKTMQLYKCTADRKKINKKPAPIGSAFTYEIKHDSSILNPIVIVSRDRLGDQWIDANYAYLKEFKRYYFIDDIETMTGGRLAFHLSVDVLYSYRGDLIGKSFIIARSESDGSSYFVDAEKALQSTKVVSYKILGHIPQDSTGNKYMLTVAGGI